MTGHLVATAHWRALEHEGDDKCRLSQVNQGWLLVGHARFRDDYGFAALDYVVRCDAAWQTLGADVAGRHGGLDVNIRIERKEGQWRLNGSDQPRVADASDIDLSFTPTTNLMPLRRLFSQSEPTLATRSAWLRYPEADLQPLDQTYKTGGSTELVFYAAAQTNFSTQLCVDKSGFVTLYPGLWEGEVTHSAP